MIQINQLPGIPSLCRMLAIAEHGNNGGYGVVKDTEARPYLCPVDLHHKELEIMQFSKTITSNYSEAPQVNELGGHLSLNCTDYSVLQWSLKLVKALCP